MKCPFAHILVATLITLASSTGCLSEIVHAPIYADINGVPYYSEGLEAYNKRYEYRLRQYPEDTTTFWFARRVYSAQNDKADINIYCSADTIIIDSLYSCSCWLGSYPMSHGKIRFSQMSPVFVGEFSYSVSDSTSNEPPRVINGKFYLQ